jgi:hypothetical protein
MGTLPFLLLMTSFILLIFIKCRKREPATWTKINIELDNTDKILAILSLLFFIAFLILSPY